MAQQEPDASPDYETVLFEVKDHVATVTLNRPQAMNSFTMAMLDEFRELWSRVRADDNIHVVVLRAAGERAFSTGRVSELVPYPQLWGRAGELAAIIAAKPPAAVQGTVRAIWETHGLDRETAQSIGWHYTRIGNPIAKAQVSRATFVKPDWTLR